MSEGVESASIPIRLHSWNDRVIVGVTLAALFSGFGQFGVVAALGDVAKSFGQVVHGSSLTDQVGLSGSQLGIGLAIIRTASLGSLPLAGLADRYGRRVMILVTVGIGLAMTTAAAVSPSYWWFVAIFALGRPFLSATNALTQVAAAEQTGSGDRAKAVALVAAGYAVGAGTIAIIHSLASSALGFRGIFALAAVPLVLVPLVSRWVVEPDRFAIAAVSEHPAPVIGAIRREFRSRVALLSLLAFAISVITGPANSFVFLYAQNVVHLSGVVTAAMVVGAGAAGLVGLLVGRWAADRIGRRPTAALGTAGVAVFGVATYTGGESRLITGYILGVVAGALLAPSLGSMVTELFPTSVRASVAGWFLVAGVLGAATGLVVFGALSGTADDFARAGALTFLPAGALAGMYWLLPETRGREPEQLWPDL